MTLTEPVPNRSAIESPNAPTSKMLECTYEVGLFYFLAALTFFHRAFCAAEIFLLAAADIFRVALARGSSP